MGLWSGRVELWNERVGLWSGRGFYVGGWAEKWVGGACEVGR